MSRKLKSFAGISKNALLSQLWIALIAYLLLCYLKFESKFSWSLYTLCSVIPGTFTFPANMSTGERMAEILRNHEISVPLTRGQEEDIDKILEDAYRFYKKNING